ANKAGILAISKDHIQANRAGILAISKDHIQGPAPTPLNQGENRGDKAEYVSIDQAVSIYDSSSSDSDSDGSSEEGSIKG
ncbi:hypothetical protein Tco_1046531, partial [Tanacetum coccineum]